MKTKWICFYMQKSFIIAVSWVLQRQLFVQMVFCDTYFVRYKYFVRYILKTYQIFSTLYFVALNICEKIESKGYMFIAANTNIFSLTRFIWFSSFELSMKVSFSRGKFYQFLKVFSNSIEIGYSVAGKVSFFIHKHLSYFTIMILTNQIAGFFHH